MDTQQIFAAADEADRLCDLAQRRMDTDPLNAALTVSSLLRKIRGELLKIRAATAAHGKEVV